jgi:hypothetical protein
VEKSNLKRNIDERKTNSFSRQTQTIRWLTGEIAAIHVHQLFNGGLQLRVLVSSYTANI